MKKLVLLICIGSMFCNQMIGLSQEPIYPIIFIHGLNSDDKFGVSEPAFDGLGFTLSYSRGTNNEFGTNDFGIDFNGSSSGYSGLRLKFSLRNKDVLYYFYPEISYASLSKDFKQFGGFEHSIRTIPITFNIGINGSQIEQLAQSISPDFNPSANFGLGYYVTEFGDDWKWTEFGYNIGLGLEYRLQPNLSLVGGFNRHSIFTSDNYTYWDWNFGLNYFLTKPVVQN